MATPSAAYRIKRDIKLMMKEPPTGIFGIPDEANIKAFHAIIVGPEGTPYEKGFFYFIVNFPDDYPLSPPHVQFMTTDGGRTRMNPNLYQCGKVCVSILGTWPIGQKWSPSQSLTSTLLSIQTLLNEKPYHNEPGHEEEDDSVVLQYNEVIMHETLRVAVLGMVLNECELNIPIVLVQFIQTKFVQYYEFYEHLAVQKRGLSGNDIEDPLFPRPGRIFRYDELLKSLENLKEAFVIKDQSGFESS